MLGSRPGPMLHHKGTAPVVQDVSGRNKRPSKFKEIEPTSAEDLKAYRADKYPGISEQARRHITKGDTVLIAFINREDVWVHVEETGQDDDVVCGRIINKVSRIQGLQIGQLVKFDLKCIAAIDDNDDDSDDDY